MTDGQTESRVSEMKYFNPKTNAVTSGQEIVLIEFERICELLSANPELGIPTQGQRRRFPLHGFPYSIIYRPAPDGLRILVVRHQSRDPTSREQQR